MTTPLPRRRSLLDFVPFYYGWVIVVLAALAMVATLPGRTHGLGMITERLLADSSLGLTRTRYGDINFWATLLGAAFCLPCGRLIDRFGLRSVLTCVLAALAATVFAMTRAETAPAFFVLILLTRGFGQSALSVVSITMVGKWFARRPGPAMGIYSVLLTVGFIAAFMWGQQVREAEWRWVWQGLGWGVAAFVPVAWLLTRDAPADSTAAGGDLSAETGTTLGRAVRTPAFWIFGGATSLFGLISSGGSLFNESILAELGFDKVFYYKMAQFGMPFGLAGQFVAGWLMLVTAPGRLLAGALALMAASLLALPLCTTPERISAYTAVMGFAGGAVTVMFFAFWSQAYGRAHLGRIQGVAQMLTVLASALGPKLYADWQATAGSYMPVIRTLGGVVAVLVPLAWLVPTPRPDTMIPGEPAPAAPGLQES